MCLGSGNESAAVEYTVGNLFPIMAKDNYCVKFHANMML